MGIPTILVEDNPTIRESLVPALREFAGVEVLAFADSADDALAAMARHPDWRLVVVDLFLRQGNGLDVVRACRGRPAGRHVVVLTNYATAEIRKRALGLGADAVFDKSTELDAFLDHCATYAGD